MRRFLLESVLPHSIAVVIAVSGWCIYDYATTGDPHYTLNLCVGGFCFVLIVVGELVYRKLRTRRGEEA